MNSKSIVFNLTGWLFGIAVFAIGVVNMFWGNDPGFGVFILLLSFVYFPPVNALFRERSRLSIPGIAKIVLALFIIWVTLGVGELSDKTDLMMMDL